MAIHAESEINVNRRHPVTLAVTRQNKMLSSDTLSNYVSTPLSDAEIAAVEKACGRALPKDVRSWLETVGSPQNVCHRLPDNADRFATMQRSMPNDTFAFATDDDLDAVFAIGPQNTVLKFTYGQKQPVDTGTTFWDYVNNNLAEPLGDIKLAWHTQLSFSTDKEEEVLALLSRAFSLTEFEGWAYVDTSPANVITHHNNCNSPHGSTFVSRQTYRGWNTPICYFNYKIPLDDIRSLKATFRHFDGESVGFKLIDYGILPFDLDSDG